MHTINFAIDQTNEAKSMLQALQIANETAAALGAEDWYLNYKKTDNEITINFYRKYLPSDWKPLFGPGNVPGWMSDDDLKSIEKLCEKLPPTGLIVEIGSFLGKSSSTFAKNLDIQNKQLDIFCIDSWQWPMEMVRKLMADADFAVPEIDDHFEMFKHYTKSYANIKPIRAVFDENFEFFRQPNLVFEDSDHSAKTLTHALPFWWEKILPGGVLAGHDYNLPVVSALVNSFAACNNLEVKKFYEDSSIWYIDKPNV